MRRARRDTVRALLLFGVSSAGLVLGPAPGRAAQALPPPPDPWAGHYHSCSDAEVGALVGKPREVALAQIKGMNIKVTRVLAPDSRVLSAPDLQRLTVIIAPNGIVTRAFCH
jgi:hypothetical protein